MKFEPINMQNPKGIRWDKVYHGQIVAVTTHTREITVLRVAIYNDDCRWEVYDPDLFKPVEETE
jgi:hypothetical protein